MDEPPVTDTTSTYGRNFLFGFNGGVTYECLRGLNQPPSMPPPLPLPPPSSPLPSPPPSPLPEAAAGQEVGSKAKPLPRLGVLRLDYGQCVGGLGEESALVRVRVCARAFSPDRSRPPLPALPRLPTATWRCRQPPIVRVPCSFQSGAWPHFRHGSRRKHTGPGGSHTRSSDEGQGRGGEGRGGRLGTSCCFPRLSLAHHDTPTRNICSFFQVKQDILTSVSFLEEKGCSAILGDCGTYLLSPLPSPLAPFSSALNPQRRGPRWLLMLSCSALKTPATPLPPHTPRFHVEDSENGPRGHHAPCLPLFSHALAVPRLVLRFRVPQHATGRGTGGWV